MKSQLLELVSINGDVNPKRCGENYIKKHSPNIHEYVSTFNLERSFKECIKLIIFDLDGLCVICDTPTKMKGNGEFTDTCSKACGYTYRTEGIQPHKVDIPKTELEYLYNIAKLQPEIIGELYECSNVTVTTRMREHGIEQRSHSEQQSLYGGTCDRWNYNGFDREIANDIEFLKVENETKSLEQIAYEIGCSRGTIKKTFRRHGAATNKSFTTSFPEKLLVDFIESLGIDFIHGDYTVLGNRELDIYIPEYNLAIECNGVYWHSDKFIKDTKYHLKKTTGCLDNNIALLHFWDYEIIEHFDIVKSMIKAKLGLIDNKVYARKCIMRDVAYNDAMQFIVDNHIQGMSSSKINKGLYYNDELVAIGTFMTPRFNKKYDYEMVRYCNSINTIVVGGMSKILSAINGSILSYANRRFSTGNVYNTCGFVQTHTSEPSHTYYNSSTRDIFSRFKGINNPDMLNADNLYKLWDCGNIVYVKL